MTGTQRACLPGVTYDQHVTVDITMLTDEAERAALLGRLLRRAALYERYEVVRRREFPIARLTLHGKPAADASEAFSGIRGGWDSQPPNEQRGSTSSV